MPSKKVRLNGVFSSDQPLGLPPGSVRAMLGLLSIGGSVFLLAKQIPVPDWWVAIVATIVGFFFAKPK